MHFLIIILARSTIDSNKIIMHFLIFLAIIDSTWLDFWVTYS